MKSGTRARAQLVDMRRALTLRLDRSVTGDNIALLGSIQSCIMAIDSADEVDDQNTIRTLMPVSERTYTEIFDNLSRPGFERVLVGENGEIDLKGVRLIRVPDD